jgi:hypothetical protein
MARLLKASCPSAPTRSSRSSFSNSQAKIVSWVGDAVGAGRLDPIGGRPAWRDASPSGARLASCPKALDRPGKALQAKLDELILTSQAQNKFVAIEKLDEAQLREMSKTLAEKAECGEDVADDKAEAREAGQVFSLRS